MLYNVRTVSVCANVIVKIMQKWKQWEDKIISTEVTDYTLQTNSKN